jgi:hypothetical protein
MGYEKYLHHVFAVVRASGVCTNQAQSCWGAHTWEYNGITVQLCDDGYTERIIWGKRLFCYQTYTHPIVFERGTEKDLEILAKGLDYGKVTRIN